MSNPAYCQVIHRRASNMSTSTSHTVILAQRPSAGETWVLDITGLQYGFKDVLVPYTRYMEEKQCRQMNKFAAYDWTETQDLDFYDMMPGMNETLLQKREHKMERKGRLHFVKFVDEKVTGDILKGSAAVFEEKRVAMGEALKSHMRKLRV